VSHRKETPGNVEGRRRKRETEEKNHSGEGGKSDTSSPTPNEDQTLCAQGTREAIVKHIWLGELCEKEKAEEATSRA